MSKIAVIGAGAAGIIAAWRAACLKKSVTLFEKTDRIGTKILISGGGKCNITHDGPLRDVLKAFRPNEAKFLRASCFRFTNKQIVEMLTSRGLEVYTRDDGRIFPTTGSAKDVTAILGSYLSESKVDLRLKSPVVSIEKNDEAFVVNGELFEKLIIASGGSSYPGSGTTGDGFRFAKSLGHTIAPVLAALAPVYMEIEGMDARAGIALRDCVVKAKQNGKEIARWRGDLLFTHRGLSGPTILGITRNIAEHWKDGAVMILVDVLPDSTFEVLSTNWKSLGVGVAKRQVASEIEKVLPKNVVSGFLADCGIESGTIFANLLAKQRNRIIENLKGWNLGTVRSVPLEKGEVVAGGIALYEVNSETMESKIVPNLFLCGEVLDIAGPVGGYNLQAAFATGFVAGDSAATF